MTDKITDLTMQMLRLQLEVSELDAEIAALPEYSRNNGQSKYWTGQTMANLKASKIAKKSEYNRICKERFQLEAEYWSKEFDQSNVIFLMSHMMNADANIHPINQRA